MDTGWGPDASAGRGRSPIRLIATAPACSGGLSFGLQGWPSGRPGSGSGSGSSPAPAHSVPALTVSPVTHEAVSPHELLGADAALVGLETCVRLHVLGQMVFHLELLVAYGAVEGSQIEMHVHVPVPHALVGEGLPTVAQKNLIPFPTSGPSRGPASNTNATGYAQAPR